MPDLCQLADVKEWLELAQDKTQADPVLTRLITATSADFMTESARPDLYPASDYIAAISGDGESSVFLPHWPINSVTSLSIDGVTVPASDDGIKPGYVIAHKDEDPELRSKIVLIGYRFSRVAAPCGRQNQLAAPNVVVSYNAGYDTVPPDVAQAVIDWVAYRYRSRSFIGQTSKSLNQGETIAFQQVDMPPNTKRAIERYRHSVGIAI
jgi:hypothetical protein